VRDGRRDIAYTLSGFQPGNHIVELSASDRSASFREIADLRYERVAEAIAMVKQSSQTPTAIMILGSVR
jgi:hypothetical protein